MLCSDTPYSIVNGTAGTSQLLAGDGKRGRYEPSLDRAERVIVDGSVDSTFSKGLNVDDVE